MERTMATMVGDLRLFAWFTLRHLRRHLVRTPAVLLGIALGVAVFTSVRLAVQAAIDLNLKKTPSSGRQAVADLYRRVGNRTHSPNHCAN
jgi:hypothetical protein